MFYIIQVACRFYPSSRVSSSELSRFLPSPLPDACSLPVSCCLRGSQIGPDKAAVPFRFHPDLPRTGSRFLFPPPLGLPDSWRRARRLDDGVGGASVLASVARMRGQPIASFLSCTLDHGCLDETQSAGLPFPGTGSCPVRARPRSLSSQPSSDEKHGFGRAKIYRCSGVRALGAQRPRLWTSLSSWKPL